jgi:hypothetical protein
MLGDIGQRAGTALLEQQCQEVDLEQDVAKLVEQLRVVTALGSVSELVGLLDRVRDDRALVLLAVPRALPSQAAGQLVEPANRLRNVVGVADPPVVVPPEFAGALPVVTPPGGTVFVLLGFGAFLQSAVTNP